MESSVRGGVTLQIRKEDKREKGNVFYIVSIRMKMCI